MSKNRQMLAVSMIYGVTVAVVAMTTSESAVSIVAMVGGLIVALGWVFYANDDSE